MNNALATADSHDLTATHPGEDLEDFVTFFVADQTKTKNKIYPSLQN